MDGYEIAALFMRYVFVFLGTLILLRSFLWLRKDARAYRKELKNLPDAGLVGEMVDLDTGESFPLPREGTIGTSRSCDIRLRDRQVGRRHAAFLFTEGKGLVVTPIARQSISLDGEQIEGKGCALHGTRIEMGNTTLRVRLFAGLNVPRRMVYTADETESEIFEEENQEAPAFYDRPFIPVEGMEENPENGWTEQNEMLFPPAEFENPDLQQEPEDFSDDMDMTWKYAPFPPEMPGNTYEEEAYPENGENIQEGQEEENTYTPPFEQPRRRRHGR